MNDLWEQHKGKTIGLIGGFIVGIIYLICGFWDALIFAFIVLLGYYFGKKADQKEEIIPISQIMDYLSQKWRMFR
ncbi:DUF2273 domain-containing protein [Paenibacillus sp. KN14-4R]|uniref:DUF2273 domain-containing protein n=1 Tax=Paenibacillus sp. KN14-4R TaxID=3445773 RepID=UPI003FA12FD0